MGISWEKSGDFSKDKNIATDDWDTWGIRLTISWKIGILIGYITSNMIFWCDWSLGIPRYPPIYGNFKSPIYDDKPVDLRSPQTWSTERLPCLPEGRQWFEWCFLLTFPYFSICPSQFGGWMNCPSLRTYRNPQWNIHGTSMEKAISSMENPWILSSFLDVSGLPDASQAPVRKYTSSWAVAKGDFVRAGTQHIRSWVPMASKRGWMYHGFWTIFMSLVVGF